MSTHLITGGAGFVGSALARRLVDEGHDVRVLDRFSRGKVERLPDEVACIRGDVCSRSAVMQAVWGVDVVWHLAYVQGTATFYADPKDVITVALKGIMNMLESCEVQGKPPEFFLVSSSEAYQTPPEGMFPTDETVPLAVPDVTNPRYSYGGGKIASEIAALAYAQGGALGRTVIIRPHNVYGPDMGRDHVIPQFAMRMMNVPTTGRHPFTIQGTGKETRSFCYIDDCIDGFMVLLEKGEDRNVYHLGNPSQEVAIEDLALTMAQWFNREIQIITGDLPKGSPTRRAPDISKLQRLGFDPSVILWDGLEETLAWYQHDAEEPLEAA